MQFSMYLKKKINDATDDVDDNGGYDGVVCWFHYVVVLTQVE